MSETTTRAALVAEIAIATTALPAAKSGLAEKKVGEIDLRIGTPTNQPAIYQG